MNIKSLLDDLAVSIAQVVARKFEANPRATTAATLGAGFVIVWLAWTAVSAAIWPPKQIVYGSVAGTVTSATGGPVANAIVTFVSEATGIGASARTDSNGRFSAAGVLPGNYAVAIRPVIDAGNAEPTKEAVLAARARLEPGVPTRFQDHSTSGLSAELKRGRNRYDIDLSRQH